MLVMMAHSITARPNARRWPVAGQRLALVWLVRYQVLDFSQNQRRALAGSRPALQRWFGWTLDLGPIILASASPRRGEVLQAAGIPFEAQASSVEERQLPGEAPDELVRRLAAEKAEAVARRRPGETRPVVGADTEVVVDGQVLGKPASDVQAARMLRLLSGRAHTVITGLCVLQPATGWRRVEAVSTTVFFATLSEDEIHDYLQSGEPRDKAGAYAIQGLASKFVERIEGCYFNVMGLPVATLYRMLREQKAESRRQ